MTLASALLGLGTAGCVVPVELADDNDATEGGTAGGQATTTPATGEGSDEQGDGTTDPTGCPPGELGCECLLDTCEDGLVCFEQACIVDMCGDDEVDLGEQCDDGNADDADGCNNDCRTSGTVIQTIDLNGEAEQSGSFAVAVDSTDAIVVSGFDRITGAQTGWVRKLDPAGNELWFDLVIQSLAVDGQDRIVIAGHEDLGTITRPWIGKLDQEGGLLWELATTEDQGMVNSIAIDSNDEILAATLVNSRAGLLRITP